MIRASTFALAGAAALSGCVHKALPVPDHARVQAIVADTGFGGAIVLGRAGEVVYAHGFGEADRERGLPFTPATAGDGGSIAKTFAAAAIHLLVAEGRLGLDDPVASHVPEFPHGATRVRHLLVHSVGLPDYDFFDADLPPGTRRDAASMLRVLANRQSAPSFVPGSRFEYSSLGYDVAALVVERVSGQPYTRFVQDRLLGPLGLRDSFPRPAFFADWPGPRTLGYRDRDGRWERFDVFDGEDFHGGSNWYVSALDLTRWAMAFARGTGLPSAVQAAVTQPARLDDGSTLGFSAGSWFCDGAGARCQYTGALRAFQTFVHWDRSRQETVVYVSNSTLPPWQRTRIARDLVALLSGAPAPESDPTPLLRVTRGATAPLAGIYRSAALGAVEFRVDKDRLSLHPAQGPSYPVYRVTADTYYVPGLDYWLGFSGDAKPEALHIRTIHGDIKALRQSSARPA